MIARDDAVKAAAEALYRGGLDRDAAMSLARLAVDAAAPHLLAAHEAEVRAKAAAEIAAAANFEPSCNEDIAHYDALMFAARIANPTTTEAAFTATCVPAGCSCDCHRWPGVSHLVACCSQPPFAPANPTTTEADA